MGLVEHARRVRETTLLAFEPIWTRATMFTAGVQHLTYIAATRQQQPSRVAPWMPLPVVNLIQPKVQRAVDFFTRNDPHAFVEPSNNTEEARMAAGFAEIVRQSLWEKNDERDLFDELATWGITNGNGFKKQYPCNSAVDMTPIQRVEMSVEPDLDDMGQPTGGQSPRWLEVRDEQGNLVYDMTPTTQIDTYVLGPLQMTWPLASPSARKAPWGYEFGLRSLEEIRNLYPDKADYLPDHGSSFATDLFHQRIASILTAGINSSVGTVDSDMLRDFIGVGYLEVRPTLEFPKGQLIIHCENIPLYIGPLPVQDPPDLSWEHFGYYRVPGRFWHRGMVEDLIDPQRSVNRLEQHIQLNDVLNGQPQWTNPDQSGVPNDAFSGRPGLVMKYKYPFKPERLQGMDLPPSVLQRRALIPAEMEEISGIRAVTMGNAPPGVQAGVALNQLAEQAEGLFAPIEKRWEVCIQNDQTRKMKLVRTYFTLPRYIGYQGGDGGYSEIEAFTGAMIGDCTKVKVQPGSFRARSKAGQQQMLFDLLNAGLLPGVVSDPSQLAEFQRRVGVSGFEAVESLDYTRAKRENERLIRMVGWEGVRRHAGDNDSIHILVHTNYRKTANFERLPMAVQMRFLQHEVEHAEAILMAQGSTDTSTIGAGEEDLEAVGGGEAPGAEGPEGDGADEPNQ